MPAHPSKQARRDALGDRIAELAAHINAATARWLKLLAEFDDLGVDDGYKTTAHWLSWRCGMSIGTARDHVRVAQRLRAWPLIAKAFERGELSYSKVRALMRLDDDFDEHLMLMYAQHASASQIEAIVRGCRRCVAVEREQSQQFAERSFGWSYDEDGAVVFRGRLPAEEGALVVRALEAARDELGPPAAEIADDPRRPYAEPSSPPPEARRADAFVAVARTALSERVSAADVYQLVVHVDADSLREDTRDEERDCRLADGSPLPAAMARRLGCDASIVRVLERDGKALSMGRKTRVISPALRRALSIRDATCRFPGCTQRAHLDAHHIEHWADGGETNLDNVVHLCRYHHTLIHKGLFGISRDPAGGFAFMRADGSPLPQAPRPLRGDCSRLASTNRSRGIRPNAWTLFPENPNPRAQLAWSVDGLLMARTPARE